jgi:two-component system invasion response regulator UvrY
LGVRLITILLVEDQELVRLGVKKLFKGVQGLKIIGEATNGEEGIRLTKELIPDVILMDITLPNMSGVEASRKMLRYNPDIKIIGLTSHADEPYPSLLLQAGASGYLVKTCSAHEIIRAIRQVHSGQCYLTAEIAQKLALRPFTPGSTSPLDTLSEREKQIMFMITEGNTIHDIAVRLFLSIKTINSYRYRIFEKLNIDSDVELTLLHLRLKTGEALDA